MDKSESTLMSIHEEMVESRRTFEAPWQDIRELVRINAEDFNRQSTVGEERTRRVFDSTAIEAAETLASGLHSYLTNPTERWFTIGVQGMRPEEYDEETLAWLEVVSDMIYQQYGMDETMFNTALHECYLDISAFGTCIPYQERSRDGSGIFIRSYPVADCFLREDVEGRVDGVSRRVRMTAQQLSQQFDVLPGELKRQVEKAARTRRFEVIHLVLPRLDRDIKKLTATNKKYASFWLCRDTKELILESGYDQLPYHVGRWMKMSSEVYGRGPAMTCLADIRTLNAMERTLLKAATKAVDPPLQVPDEGFMLPIETSPAAIIYKEADAPEIIPLKQEGNLNFGHEYSEVRRERIRRCFYAEWLKMEDFRSRDRVTGMEVSERRDEKLRLMAPMLGRIQGETLGPMIRRSYTLLQSMNRLPPAPGALMRRRLKVYYVSPAARAQHMAKANEMSRYMQELAPVAQIDPGIFDVIDMDKFAAKLAELRGVTRTVLRSADELAQMRQQKQQMQALAQGGQVAEPLTKSIKNLADAREKGLDVNALAQLG